MAAHAAVARLRACGSFSCRAQLCSTRRGVAVVSTRGNMNYPFFPSAQLSMETLKNATGGSSGKDSNQGCYDHAVALLARAPVLPKLVVVDLDYTVWPSYWYLLLQAFSFLCWKFSCPYKFSACGRRLSSKLSCNWFVIVLCCSTK